MKISIITPYYNRRNLFLKTLESIRKTKHEDYEIIVVDDGSDEEHQLRDVEGITLIEVDKETKTHVNPCVAYNKALEVATGDIILTQHSECYHVGDILTWAERYLQKKQYVSFGCYSLDIEYTNKLQAGEDPSDFVLPFMRFINDGGLGFYNHSLLRPCNYHFAAVIYKEDLDAIGGYDQSIADEVAFDDDILLYDLAKNGVDIRLVNFPMVLHQNHFGGDRKVSEDYAKSFEVNKQRFIDKHFKEITAFKLPNV